MQQFNCDRTCRAFQFCRFQPILRALSLANSVFSHTTRVKVDLTDMSCLKAAIAALKGKIRDTDEGMIRFYLLGWNNTIRFNSKTGTLTHDDYYTEREHTSIDELMAEYSRTVVIKKARDLGWDVQVMDGRVTVFHPEGGQMVWNGESIEADGFTGSGCRDAAEPFIKALGQANAEEHKPEIGEEGGGAPPHRLAQ